MHCTSVGGVRGGMCQWYVVRQQWGAQNKI